MGGKRKCASEKMIISPDWTFMERKMAMQERRYEQEEERKMKQELQMNQEDGEKRDHKSWRKSTTAEEKKICERMTDSREQSERAEREKKLLRVDEVKCSSRQTASC